MYDSLTGTPRLRRGPRRKDCFYPCWSYVSPFSYDLPVAYLGIVGGTGLFACQLAKNIFKAAKVITAVSTQKVPRVKELLGEGVVDDSRWTLIRFNMKETYNFGTSHRL